MGVISRLHTAPVKKHPPPTAIKRARDLRRQPTDAEQEMWRLLREFFPEGRWRRQVPIRHFITDFASHRWRLVIELDGGQHNDETDAPRTALIKAEGYRVVRFWNNEVLQNGHGCAERLAMLVPQDHPHPAATRQSFDKLRTTKSPHPSPIKGEEE